VDKKEFWNFSWYDMGEYDIPAVIDYIQYGTGGQKVAVIGHSQGTTQMFSTLSEDPDYFADKVSLFVALAPVTTLGNTEIPLLPFVAKFYDTIEETSKMFGMYEVGAKGQSKDTSICTKIPQLCEQMSRFFVNRHPALDDPDAFAVSSAHGPAGTSVRDL